MGKEKVLLVGWDYWELEGMFNNELKDLYKEYEILSCDEYIKAIITITEAAFATPKPIFALVFNRDFLSTKGRISKLIEIVCQETFLKKGLNGRICSISFVQSENDIEAKLAETQPNYADIDDWDRILLFLNNHCKNIE